MLFALGTVALPDLTKYTEFTVDRTIKSKNIAVMERPDAPGSNRNHIEYQLAVKKAAYADAMKKGAIFNELKKMFLEIKRLQSELQDTQVQTC
jgi:NADH:ubiquinone oxidoreductase subunit D